MDTEASILDCWNIIEDLELAEKDPSLIPSIIQLYRAKFERCWSTFEKSTYNEKM